MAAEASSSTPRYSYHVFLSFTEDTCKTFSDHLYTALVGTGLHTFRDDDHGDESDDAIKAIKESRRDLGTLSLLHTLNLSGNPICSVPGNLKGLTSLFTLTLDRCTRLKSLLELPMRFAGVSLTGCSSLEMVTNLPNLLQQLNLDILDCKKLVEVRGVFKLEPIANIDSEMINNLCLTELDSMGMVEVELCNNLTNSIIKAPTLQGLHECGIYSIFLSGSEIPSWFDKKNRNSSMSFTVPSLPHLKFCGLNICVVYACATNVSQAEWSYEYIKVSNKTKGLKWAYRPTFRGTAYEHKDVIWLSDWKIADLLMECGDEMNIFVNMAELFKVKEFGIRILYDEEEQKGIQNNTGYPFNQNVIDLSAYQMKKGEYFLCNLDDIGRGLHYSRMSEPKWECLENTGEMEVEEGGSMWPGGCPVLWVCYAKLWVALVWSCMICANSVTEEWRLSGCAVVELTFSYSTKAPFPPPRRARIPLFSITLLFTVRLGSRSRSRRLRTSAIEEPNVYERPIRRHSPILPRRRSPLLDELEFRPEGPLLIVDAAALLFEGLCVHVQDQSLHGEVDHQFQGVEGHHLTQIPLVHAR
ncbi:hypothetical protein TEA_005054 [Camellia sinensis var. sinensis]|uniref:ADP-ribosyl cyclase/cyclic ADP-ribose hydrolase n=1 Tax=Camellia sinensis var. sinensis TaxID=542762 RepID=A0A4V3WJZ0_CAMSN|nr:hypothetical protein TEA_005054 [Camellia sinensis var. sinensis]